MSDTPMFRRPTSRRGLLPLMVTLAATVALLLGFALDTARSGIGPGDRSSQRS